MTDLRPRCMGPKELLRECLFFFTEEDYRREYEEIDLTANDEEEEEKTACASKKEVKCSPAIRKVKNGNDDVILPIGWDRMEKDEMIAAFMQINKGKEIPEYLLSNLREASYPASKTNSGTDSFLAAEGEDIDHRKSIFDPQDDVKGRKEKCSATGCHWTCTDPGCKSALSSRANLYRHVEDGQEVDTSETSTGVGEPSKKPVARKSTTTAKKPELSSVKRWELEGTIFQSDIKRVPTKKFRPHSCSSDCLAEPQYQYREAEHKQLNTLQIPLALGWERQLAKPRAGGRKRVFYTAPCGRRMRSLDDTHRYLTCV